jgi:PAS domain S-box-containing protein
MKSPRLHEILRTDELARRPSRPADYQTECRVLNRLAEAMTESPGSVLQKLVDTALELCQAGSSGVSLLETEAGEPVFRWRAVAGEFAPHVGGATPRDFSPCGVVLDLNQMQLMADPARVYPYIGELHSRVAEVLLVPFHRDGQPLGTVWVVAHTDDRKFDAEDARLMTSLARFASSAVQALSAESDAQRDGEKLRDAKTRLESTLDAASVATWVWDVPSNRVFGDRNLAKLLSMSPADVDGGPLEKYLKVIHADDLVSVSQEIERTLSEGGPFEVECRIVQPGGDVRWVVARGRVERDPNGVPLQFPGVVIDVTERKHAEERERALANEAAMASAKFKAVFDQSFVYAGVMTVDGILVDVNRSAVERCGYRREDVLGKPFWETGWWRGSQAVQERVRKATAQAAAGRTIREELPYFFADGTERIADFTMNPVRDESGRVAFLVPTGLDITDRKRAEDDRQKFVSLAEQSRDFIGIASLEGRFEYVNRAGRALIGLDSSSELSALGLADLAVAGLRQFMADTVIPTALTSDHWQGDVSFQNVRTGEPILMEQVVFLIRDPRSGEPFHLATVARDIREKKQSEYDLRTADRRKDEFLATLAHELRNPLAAISNAVQLLRYASSDPAAANESRALIERQVRQLARLVDDLLDVSRISSGKLILRREPAELTGIVRSAQETSRPVIEANGHHLTVELPSRPIHLDADPARLAQVFLNLLTNAAKYSEAGGRIAVKVDQVGSEARVRIKDSGIGISPEMLPKIFELFTQVDRSLERSQGGLGIGLTLVKRLVEMHGGRVEAQSEGPGRGSEFTVWLPAQSEAPPDEFPASANPGTSAEPSATRPKRILVVDDNHDAAKTLSMLLQLSGNDVRTSHDGIAALKESEVFRPDLLLLDIGLPGLNGYEVAQRVRANPELSGVTLVAVTGWVQEDDRRRCREVGFDHHLAKPVDLSAVENILSEIPNRSEAQRGNGLPLG